MEIQRRANVPPLGVAHRATCNTHLYGYSVPEGTIILTSLYSVHMDKKFWKDPMDFRPERFLNEHGKLTVPEWNFIPFGHGRYLLLISYFTKTLYNNFLLISFC